MFTRQAGLSLSFHSQRRPITMDELEAHLPPDLPLFVKIDVEGHELIIIEELLGSHHARRQSA